MNNKKDSIHLSVYKKMQGRQNFICFEIFIIVEKMSVQDVFQTMPTFLGIFFPLIFPGHSKSISDHELLLLSK
jgi:hypothetical protein